MNREDADRSYPEDFADDTGTGERARACAGLGPSLSSILRSSRRLASALGVGREKGLELSLWRFSGV